jgi:hypothetical protein
MEVFIMVNGKMTSLREKVSLVYLMMKIGLILIG